MKKSVSLITVPYDSAHFNQRMGAGPLHILNGPLIQNLRDSGRQIFHKQITLEDVFSTEVASAFKLLKQVKAEVVKAIQNKSFPIVLAGNCCATVGVLAGNYAADTGVIWLDAHGDCETPESTASGFLDGMGLSIALNKCWQNLLVTSELNTSLKGKNVILIGARAISTGEQKFILNNGIHHITVEQIKDSGEKAMKAAFSKLIQDGVREVHLHIDADVMDPSAATANSYAADNGLSKKEIFETITFCTNKIPVKSVTIASYDPSFDKDNQMFYIINEIIETLIDGFVETYRGVSI